MFGDQDIDIRYHALQMALDMTRLNDLGMCEPLGLSEVLNAAAAFELFMLESSGPNGDAA